MSDVLRGQEMVPSAEAPPRPATPPPPLASGHLPPRATSAVDGITISDPALQQRQGGTVIFDIISQSDTGAVLDGQLTFIPAKRMRIGLDCKDADLTTDLRDYPRMAYQRVFSPGALPRHDSGKLSTLPQTCIPHVSWKNWDEPALVAWLAGVRRSMYLTYYHEPMGDVDPAVYRLRSARLAELAADQPLVLGTGPILTRYWLDEGNGDPSIWHTDADRFFGVDCYNGSDARYRPPDEMFGQSIAYGNDFGLPVLVPEWGVERIALDTSGQARAQLLRDSIRYLAEHQVVAVAWWNLNQDRLSADPERATFQTLVDMQ